MPEEEEEGIGIISEGTLGLGELARLTVSNEAEVAYDVRNFVILLIMILTVYIFFNYINVHSSEQKIYFTILYASEKYTFELCYDYYHMSKKSG